MPNIKEVARAAGVSVATVSRVINKIDVVSPKLRDKVTKVIADMGYKPNEIAKSLKTHQTKRLAVIVTSFSRTFFTSIIVGIQKEAAKYGYSLLFAATLDNLDTEKSLVEFFACNWVDGIILASSVNNDAESTEYVEYLGSLQKNNTPIPVVTLEFPLNSDSIDSVCVDYEHAAFDAVSYLIGQNRTKIAHISHPAGNRIGDQRIHGYKRALLQAGLPVRDEYIASGDYSTFGGYKAIGSLLDTGISIDAVYCANDQAAVGVIKMLEKREFRIPEDIAVMGNDDNFVTSILTPSLSTIGIHKNKMGVEAVRLLHKRINGKAPAKRVQIMLDYEIIERASTKKGIITTLRFLDW